MRISFRAARMADGVDISSMLNGLDLFSGIGGISVALRPWVKTIAYCERDRYAQGVLLSRMHEGSLPDAPIWDDVKTLDLASLALISNLQVEEADMAGKLKKLTEDQVNSAMEGYDQGMSLADLAHIYGVTRQSMHDLLKRRMELRPNLRYGSDNHFYRGGLRADKRAHDIMEKAILKGELVNPGICEQCDDRSRFADGRIGVQGHHDDYAKPLSVRWLCQRCHHEWHKLNQPQRGESGGQKESGIDIITAGFP